MFSPVGRNCMFCQRCYNFCSSDFVSGKVDPSIALRQSSLSTHESNFRRAEFILQLDGVRDGTSAFVPHASFLSRDNIDEIITYVAASRRGSSPKILEGPGPQPIVGTFKSGKSIKGNW
jgi:hypothetical protein